MNVCMYTLMFFCSTYTKIQFTCAHTLCIQLYKWLSEKLPEAGKLPSELSLVITPVFASLEDRSADVRKAAQLVLPPLTQHIGYDVMIKQAGKLKVCMKIYA